MNEPGQEPLPKYIWVETMQQWMRAYGSVDEIDPTEFTPGVPTNVLVVSSSLDADIGQTAIGDNGTLYAAPQPAGMAGAAPGGFASWWKSIKKAGQGFLAGEAAIIRTAAASAALRAAIWKAVKFFTYVAVGYTVAMTVINKTFSTEVQGLDIDGDGDIDVISQCISSLFAGKRCTLVDLDTGNQYNQDLPDPFGEVIKMVGLVAALGIGAYIVVKVIIPATERRP